MKAQTAGREFRQLSVNQEEMPKATVKRGVCLSVWHKGQAPDRFYPGTPHAACRPVNSSCPHTRTEEIVMACRQASRRR